LNIGGKSRILDILKIADVFDVGDLVKKYGKK